MKLSILLAVVALAAMLGAGEAAPQKHSLSGNVSPGAGGKPLVGLSYGFNPNKNLNLNAGVSHQFGGGTSYGVGFKWRFRRDAKLKMD